MSCKTRIVQSNVFFIVMFVQLFYLLILVNLVKLVTHAKPVGSFFSPPFSSHYIRCLFASCFFLVTTRVQVSSVSPRYRDIHLIFVAWCLYRPCCLLCWIRGRLSDTRLSITQRPACGVTGAVWVVVRSVRPGVTENPSTAVGITLSCV